jgi:haloalkane dehalogenase
MPLRFVTPDEEELALLRADPLLWEQELDVRPEVAAAIEQATAHRSGRVYWRSAHDHLYALELADLGRGRPSMAMVYGFWDRYEPRPPEHEITADLLDLSLWVAEIVEGIDPADVARVATFALGRKRPTWSEGSVLRTPDECFAELPGYPYPPRYVEIEGLRMAYVETGAGDPILCLHGEPTWGYLYRRMIPTLAAAGRVIVPDLIGFGRSDKPVAPNAYSYRAHVRWVQRFIETLDLRRITLVCQDWGGLIGLRVLARQPERFARLVAMNTAFPTGEAPSEAFLRWRRFSQRARWLDLAAMMRQAVRRPLADAEAAAYSAPFPDARYQTGALVFPRLVPIRPDHPGAYDNRRAIATLRMLDLPVLLPWGDSDPITGEGEAQLRGIFRNVAPPFPVRGAGHFIQEDRGEEVADGIVRWLRG